MGGPVFVWAILALVLGGADGFGLSDVGDVVEFAREVIHDVMKTWELVGHNVVAEDAVLPSILKGKEKKVIGKMMAVSEEVERAGARLSTGILSAVSSLAGDLPRLLRYQAKIDRLADMVAKIETADRSFTDYLNTSSSTSSTTGPGGGGGYERLTLESFAVYVVSHGPDSVHKVLDQLHTALVPRAAATAAEVQRKKRQDQDQDTGRGGGGRAGLGQGMFDLIRDSVQEVEANLCDVQQSPHQLLYNIYVSLQMTQLKGYKMMQFSWMLLRLYNRGNFTLEAQTSRDRYLSRMEEQTRAVKSALEKADRGMWRCDPRSHKEDETYTQLTRLLQGYIVNEVNLNPQKSCSETCGYYDHAKQYDCYEKGFCQQQERCNGKVTDCKFVDSDMTICSADSRSHRRYNWIKYENGNILGEDKSCTNVRKVDSWWRYLFWHCSYCLCICDDPHYSDRYFNLRPAVSDIGNNMVVTSLKFTKSDHVVHLQIEEGRLTGNGVVNESTVGWRPVDQYIIGDESAATAIRTDPGVGRPGIDFHRMSWEQRAIDLDSLVAPTGYVLTGVKFRLLGSHLNLEIRITPFNFSDGRLINPHLKSQWISNDNTDGATTDPRRQLEVENGDVPTRSPMGSRPDSTNDTFVLFTHSSMSLDVAQHTIPFLDAQPASPRPVGPLSGAGLIHKGRPGYGGFIAPKVFTLNMADYLRADHTDTATNDK